MSHHAIIKGNRKDLEWYFCDNSNFIGYIKKLAIEKDGQNRAYAWNGISYKDRWRAEIKNHNVKRKYYDTGTYTEWEGIMNLDILQEGVYIFVPSLNEYHPVNKVEANTDGKVTYYTEYTKGFDENSEPSRLIAVEDWFKTEYPMYDSFDKLINHKDDVNMFQKEYDDYIEGGNKIIKQKDVLKEKYNYEKPITLTDSSKKDSKSWWQRLFD